MLDSQNGYGITYNMHGNGARKWRQTSPSTVGWEVVPSAPGGARNWVLADMCAGRWFLAQMCAGM